MSAPDVSVVTVVRNGVKHIEHVLASVAAQRGVRTEHVVIDGGSTDGTVEILRRHTPRLGYWVSEPDSGISDAMNKGAARARGEWLMFLQSDDYFAADDALARALACATPTAGFIACTLHFVEPGRVRAVTPTGFSPYLNLKLTLQHQATLIRRSTFEGLGGYDAGLHFYGDYDLFLRAKRAGIEVVVAPEIVLGCMRAGGFSGRLDWPALSARFGEERKIHFRHAPGAVARLLYAAWWSLYLPYRRLRSLLRPVAPPT